MDVPPPLHNGIEEVSGSNPLSSTPTRPAFLFTRRAGFLFQATPTHRASTSAIDALAEVVERLAVRLVHPPGRAASRAPRSR